MIRYLVDARPLQEGSALRGIGTYVRGLLAGLHAVQARGVGVLLASGRPRPAATRALPVHPIRLAYLNRHVQPLFDPLQVTLALAARPPRLYHAVEYAQPLSARVPVVATVHDLIPFVLPEMYPWMRRERALPLRQLRHADAVIAVSRATADDVIRIAGVEPRRIVVVHEGVDRAVPLREESSAEIRARLRLPARFLLAVGTFDPRKRVDLLATVVRRVRAEHDVSLVIAGFQGSFQTAVDQALHQAGISDVTRVLGHVTPLELGGLYQLADALVFTSAYEGFGLPPLEAMAAGTPVAAMANSSVPEVVGDAALLTADGDAAAMAQSLSAMLADPAERDRLIAAGRARAAQLTWDRTARQTLDVYDRVLRARS